MPSARCTRGAATRPPPTPGQGDQREQHQHRGPHRSPHDLVQGRQQARARIDEDPRARGWRPRIRWAPSSAGGRRPRLRWPPGFDPLSPPRRPGAIPPRVPRPPAARGWGTARAGSRRTPVPARPRPPPPTDRTSPPRPRRVPGCGGRPSTPHLSESGPRARSRAPPRVLRRSRTGRTWRTRTSSPRWSMQEQSPSAG